MKLGLLGYGSQGRAEALNLRKSNFKFHLGIRPGRSWDKAVKDGLEPMSPEECIEKSEIVFLNLPDQTQANFYREHLQKQAHLRWIVFAHGFSTSFQLIPVEPQGPAHILIAPKGAASGLEKLYGTPKALPGVLAYEATKKNPIGPEEKIEIEKLALALGCHPKAVFWASFKDECICDLFSEQALLCGGVSSILKKSFETLVEAGYNPKTAYFETLYELKLIVDLIWEHGISGMRYRISPTARYGDVTRGDRVIDDSVKENMKKILSEIESGKFTQEFLEKNQSSEYQGEMNRQSDHEIEKIGTLIREQMQS